MPDDKHKWLEANNDRDAAIRYLAENTDLSPNQAKELVDKHGTDLEELLKMAKTIKAEG